jgi:hypothetical protein
MTILGFGRESTGNDRSKGKSRSLRDDNKKSQCNRKSKCDGNSRSPSGMTKRKTTATTTIAAARA